MPLMVLVNLQDGDSRSLPCESPGSRRLFPIISPTRRCPRQQALQQPSPYDGSERFYSAALVFVVVLLEPVLQQLNGSLKAKSLPPRSFYVLLLPQAVGAVC